MRTYHTATLLLIIALLLNSQLSSAQTNQHRFAETGYTVMGRFLSYWQSSGGLARFGYPLSDQTSEVSELNGKSYTVQYFERAEFELHPENQPPYDVLLSQLGRLRYNEKYGNSTPAQRANSNHPLLFPQTGKQTGGVFATYWQAGGGLASFGYPISNEFQEQSELDGKTYTVEYFERAVMELHPENQAPYNVLLTQLGRFRLAGFQAQSFRLEPRYGRPFGLRASAHYAVWLEQPPRLPGCEHAGRLQHRCPADDYDHDYGP